MFPYVRQNLDAYLAENWDSPALQACLPKLAVDIDQPNVDAWLVAAAVIGLMDADIKATGLKDLQGQIWKSGFHGGQMTAHLFDEVANSIGSWKAQGLDVRIYSSGSIAAQKLFFGHTIAGDLLDQFSGHYDTTTGPKREASSYETIAADFDCDACQILFISDVVEELAAAKAAGLQTALSVRPGNQPAPAEHGFLSITGFDQLNISAA
ncbi:UNVERIFIED_CONTAM: hypothetical protein GTU68_018012 [Idotea baltica]|nr:hypothetical protein [Idotea baltica]